MASSHIKWSALVLLLLSVLVSNCVMGDFPCDDTLAWIKPCESFLIGHEGLPRAECCFSVMSMGQMAIVNEQNRRSICKCIKDVARSTPKIILDHPMQVPQLCNVEPGVHFNPNIPNMLECLLIPTLECRLTPTLCH